MVSEHRINPTMLKILIVDDDPSLALLFRLLFERHGCNVLSCSSAESAIRSTNYGQATSDLAKFQVLSQTGISALAQANSVQQEILKLLQ